MLQFEFKGELLEFDYVLRLGIYAFLDQLLDKGYELAIFTAGVQPYADAVLDSFDPMGCYFGQDHFYRQHMVEEKKDLCALFGDCLAGGAVLIDDNTHEVLPSDQLDYAVLVDHWCGDQVTTAQALASLESAAKALTDKLSMCLALSLSLLCGYLLCWVVASLSHLLAFLVCWALLFVQLPLSLSLLLVVCLPLSCVEGYYPHVLLSLSSLLCMPIRWRPPGLCAC